MMGAHKNRISILAIFCQAEQRKQSSRGFDATTRLEVNFEATASKSIPEFAAAARHALDDQFTERTTDEDDNRHLQYFNKLG